MPSDAARDFRHGQARGRPPLLGSAARPLATNPFWTDVPAVWEQVLLGGYQLPGLAVVTGDVTRKVDSVSAPGSDGASLRDKGYEAAKIKIVLRMWTREQFDLWETLLPILNPRRHPARREALAIYSASLAEAEIDRVYITGMSLLGPSQKGMREATLSLIQHAPPSRRNVTRNPGRAGADIGARPIGLGPGAAPAATPTPADTQNHP